MKLTVLSVAVGAIMLLAVACAQEAEEPPSSPEAQSAGAVPAADEPPQAVPTVRPDRVDLVKSAMSPDGLQAILGTADLGVGPNRVGFVLLSSKGFVTEPTVVVTSRLVGDDGSEGQTVETKTAELKPWPYGNRGLYVTSLTFDRAGNWGIDISVDGAAGTARKGRLLFDVAGSVSAPDVGAPAIKSVSKTAADVESLAELTTGSLGDIELYQSTIAEAVTSGEPTVIVFASPAFCTNEVCGPQVEVLQEIKNEFKGQGHFIHVDFYDNPDEIQGDLDKARLSPSVVEWSLPSIEWTFVVDRSGIVTARFEGFATFTEVRDAFLDVL